MLSKSIDIHSNFPYCFHIDFIQKYVLNHFLLFLKGNTFQEVQFEDKRWWCHSLHWECGQCQVERQWKQMRHQTSWPHGKHVHRRERQRKGPLPGLQVHVPETDRQSRRYHDSGKKAVTQVSQALSKLMLQVYASED